MNTKLQGAITFLEEFCSQNSVVVKHKRPTDRVLIVTTEDGKKASVGVDLAGNLKCYYVNPAQVKWAKMEGFSDEDIFEGKVDGLVEEITLRDLASFFVGGVKN